MTISAKIIKDSYNPYTESRITTFELEYPRFIHSEFLTHHAIVKNSASSRAIPVKTMIDTVRNNPAMPIHWGKAQPGMQAYEECDEKVTLDDYECSRNTAWKCAMEEMTRHAEAFAKAGYHKQIVNRLTEPFQHMKVVATATDWNNFLWLRNHADAQPEIHELARLIQEQLDSNNPRTLDDGEWHLPYVHTFRSFDLGKIYNQLLYSLDFEGQNVLTAEQALKISASMCAQVSYRKSDQSLQKALDIYDRLVNSEPVHASPFEHQAKCFDPRDADCWPGRWLPGITHYTKDDQFYSGNLRGWIQHRQLIPNNVKREVE